jgi:hypothetical protein
VRIPRQATYDKDENLTLSIEELDAFFHAQLPQERTPKLKNRRP